MKVEEIKRLVNYTTTMYRWNYYLFHWKQFDNIHQRPHMVLKFVNFVFVSKHAEDISH